MPVERGEAVRRYGTLLTAWADARPSPTSRRRTEWLSRYLHRFNHARANRALRCLPPMLRSARPP